MYNYIECVRFNELEIGHVFDFRTAVGVLYQVVDFTGILVVYRPLNDVFSKSLKYDYRIANGVVGFYEKEGVWNG